MSAREEMLARIRASLGPSPQPPVIARGYRVGGEHPPGSPALLDLLEDRLVDYKAQVHRSSEADLAAVLARVLAGAPPGTLAVPEDLPADWTGTREVLRDRAADPLGTDALDGTVGVVTGCAVAVAETGTIVLDAGPRQGRRAITLVPDLHVCVVRAEQVVHSVPEAVRLLDPVATGLRPQTWISGPSATSDIELSRVEGVHGPRTLHVVLVIG